MSDLQKIAIKRKDNADLRISADPALLTWLANTFRCSKESAVTALVSINERRKSADDSSKI